jgi:sRNA-binding protein
MRASSSASDGDRQLAIAAIGRMSDPWPRCFALLERRRRPLKISIHADVLVAGAGALTPAEVMGALRRYCGSVGYLRNCIADAARIDLDGKVAGRVSADEARYAAERLAQRKPRVPRPKPARLITPAPKPSEPIKQRITLAVLKLAAQRRQRGAA